MRPYCRVIQILPCEHLHAAVYALCEDGSIWILQTENKKWTLVTEIPEQGRPYV